MSPLRNKVLLIGNVGQEPTVTNLENNKKVARISLATNKPYKNGNCDKKTDTNWHTLVALGKTVDIVEKYVTKGKEIAIEGKLTSRSYEDKGGVKCYVIEVVISEILLMGSGN